jgi:cob(I)alamin adenosyltransferase
MNIYTRTGDQGETGLFAGPRVPKDSPRIEAYGTVDELNAALGIARCESLPEDLDQLLARVQHELFAVGAELATPDPVAYGVRSIGDRHIQAIEAAIDDFQARLDPLRVFILPGGSRGAAALNLARTICRRAERRLITLIRQSNEPISLDLVAYLNRLGDLLFVLGRVANAAAGQGDIPWQKDHP